MKTFALTRANDPAQAIATAAKAKTAQQGAEIRFVGGGTTLIDLMKLNVEQPQTLIDINALFGIRSVRQQKRIEVVVQLEDWDNTREYDRTGLDQQRTELLDVELPLVTVPLNPGKNLTVICEVVAMNHLLRYSGVDSANAFNERLIRRMREKGGVKQYLEEDYE